MRAVFFLLYTHIIAAGIFACGAVPAAFAAVDKADADLFSQANALYREGKYKEAAAAYRTLYGEYPETPVFSYNLANSLYRSKQLGPSILFYERAQKADPRNPDIRHNLNYARGSVAYRVEDKRNWYLKAGEKVLEYFREKEVYILSLLAFFVFAAAWVIHLFRERNLQWGAVRKFSGILLLIVLPLAAAKNIEARVMKDAIILAKEAEVRYGPSISDQIAFRIGEGVKVYVIDSRQDWSRIILVNGESGWIKNSQLEQV